LRAYPARPEVLQGRVSKTVKLIPVKDYWYLVEGINTHPCPEPGHDPNCIRFEASLIQGSRGVWRLKVPIDVYRSMPGSGHVLALAQLDSMIRIGWGTWIVKNDRAFSVVDADTGDVLWEAVNEMIFQGDGKFETNTYKPNVSVSGIRRIDVVLSSLMLCVTGGFSTHFANMMLTFEYVPDKPPEPATVKVYVYDRQTNRPVRGAFVQILAGDKVVAEGYTGWDGWAVFSNVPACEEGTGYALLVSKSGYHEHKDVIEVFPGENSFRVALTPMPSPPIPWEWILAGVAVVTIGGVAIASAARRRPEVVVVR